MIVIHFDIFQAPKIRNHSFIGLNYENSILFGNRKIH